jgi:uncharacterized membrane protein
MLPATSATDRKRPWQPVKSAQCISRNSDLMKEFNSFARELKMVGRIEKRESGTLGAHTPRRGCIVVSRIATLHAERRSQPLEQDDSSTRKTVRPCYRGKRADQCIPSESTGKSAMSNLVVLGFDGIHTADEVLNKLRSLQKEYLIDLEDACVVERLENGKAFINQAVNLTAIGAAAGGGRGALWGTLVGLLFLNPLAGMAIGAITGAGFGALSGSLADYGIRDDFVRKLSDTIPPGSSALFILFRSATEDKVLAEIQPYKPRILKTSLPNEAEQRLKTVLSKAA